MGCNSSKKELIIYSNIYKEKSDVAENRSLYEAMCFHEKDIGQLYTIFRKVDKDSSGTLEIIELLMYLDIEKNPFNKRAFSVLDEDNSGTVDFKEFVLSLWNYCTLGKATLLMFAFDIYDVDSSGVIDASEILRYLQNLKDIFFFFKYLNQSFFSLYAFRFSIFF